MLQEKRVEEDHKDRNRRGQQADEFARMTADRRGQAAGAAIEIVELPAAPTHFSSP